MLTQLAVAGRHLAWLVAGCLLLTMPGCSCSNSPASRVKGDYKRDKSSESEPPRPAAKPADAATAGKGAPAATPTAPGSPAAPASTTAGELPVGGAAEIVVQPLDPSRDLTLAERRQGALVRMRKIGRAIGDYVQQHKQYPPAASYSAERFPLLSWRVHLLPYLGHPELFAKFHLNEPWNSPHNKQLLAEIPSVYQSPERKDQKTNFLLAAGPVTMFAGTQGVRPQEIADGLTNTVMLLEVDDKLAAPWTQPVDYNYDEESDPRRGLGGLRDDGLFVVWANATVNRIPPNIPDAELRPMFTRSGREPFLAAAVSKPAQMEVDPAFVGRLKPAAGVSAVAETGDASPTKSPSPGAPAVGPAATSDPIKTASPAVKTTPRLPVPDETAQEKSKALFNQIYRPSYDNARSAQQKYEFAKQLVEKAAQLKDDPAGRYVLLTVASKVAAEAGDTVTALQVAEQLIAGFEVPPFETRTEALLRSFKQAPYNKACNDKFISEGEKLLSQALLNDNFALAQELHTVALAAARRSKDKYKVDELTDRRREIELARQSYAKVEKVVYALKDNPEDPDNNLTVGKYFCFIKRNWERGLPMLALGSDDSLKRLARAELNAPADPEAQTQLADDWWDRAEREKDKDGLRREMLHRAVYWYQLAMPRLPAGLLQVKVEVRVKEAERAYGKRKD